MEHSYDKRRRGNLLHNELSLVLFSLLTGATAGVTVTIYNVLAHYGEECSVAWYEALLANPALIPLLFVALIFGALVVGTVLKFIPLARGSGIPQVQGAIRGGIVLKWFRLLTTGFALSLATIFLGMSAGSEGPSMLIGGTSGAGIGAIFKRDARSTRYMITGGASAGLAVVFNAPLTGFLFAFEEAHKKFTPEIFLTAFFSVVSGILTRNGLRTLLGFIDPSITVSSTFHAYDLSVITSFNEIWGLLGVVLIGSIVVAMLGVGFYYAVMALRPLFGKLNFFKGTGKYLIPFLLAGAFGLISIYEMGGGHSLIESLGTNGGQTPFTITLNFASHVVVAIVVVLIMKFIASVCNMGAGVPCGVFIPMLAVGACAGGLISYVAQACGMSAIYSDVIVMICMATFFATIVKAPLTSMVMVFELTGSYNFNLLLPVMLGVSIGYLLG
ncbi:MAG: chloride channel protein, partial [Clostridia bacterium]|nr:chloride channel protein [Clostridia bacterium]